MVMFDWFQLILNFSSDANFSHHLTLNLTILF